MAHRKIPDVHEGEWSGGWHYEQHAVILDTSLGRERGANYDDERSTYTEYLDVRWRTLHQGELKGEHDAKIRITIVVGSGKYHSNATVERYEGKRWVEVISMPGQSCGVTAYGMFDLEEKHFREAADRLFALTLRILLRPEVAEAPTNPVPPARRRASKK